MATFSGLKLDEKDLDCLFETDDGSNEGTSMPAFPTVSTPAPPSAEYSARSKCAIHNEDVSYWCIKCVCKICQTCLENNHDGHPMRTYKKHLQKEVKDRLTCLGAQTDGFKKELQRNIDYSQDGIKLLKNKIDSCQGELDIMEKDKKAYTKLLESEPTLRAFSNGSSDVDLELVGSLLSLMDKRSLPVPLKENSTLVLKFTINASFEDLNNWKIGVNHWSSKVLINYHKFRICAKRFKKPESKTHYLALHSFCCPLHYRSGWEYKIKTFTFCLKSSDCEDSDEVRNYCKESIFNEKRQVCGFNTFTEWDDMLKSDFMWDRNGKPYIRVQLTVETCP